MAMKLTEQQIKKLVILSVIVLFITSLMLPAFYSVPKDYYKDFISVTEHIKFGKLVNIYLGRNCLAFGWLGIFFLGTFGTISWFANIFFIPILVTYAKNRPSSIIMSFIALILALSAHSLKVLEDIDGGMDDGSVIVAWGTGFYCWLSVYIILTIATSIQALQTNYADHK